jgi:hypothetical protein
MSTSPAANDAVHRPTGCINAVRVVALLIAVAAPLATAQNPLSNEKSITHSPDCLPRATRTRESCDPRQVVVRLPEHEIDASVEFPGLKGVQCAATIEVAYTQRDINVGVEGTIAHNTCGASSGDYKLVVSVRNQNRELQTLEFFESWQRQDDQPVRFSGVYPIGENVDVVRVRTVQSRCTCADVPQGD